MVTRYVYSRPGTVWMPMLMRVTLTAMMLIAATTLGQGFAILEQPMSASRQGRI